MMRTTYTLLRSAVTAIALSFLSYTSTAQAGGDNCKFLGNVIAASAPAGFESLWNQVTPENAGKWGSVEATQDAMSWAGLDNAYGYAQNRNLPFKQHTLVWGQQQPAWMNILDAGEQKQEVEEWIREYCERYPETDFIDVVNEPLHAVPDYRAALGGSGVTGWDWVIWAFEKARDYCPNAQLVLNDYNILSSNDATTRYLEIIRLLKDRGLIDVVGEQGHFLETTPLETIKNNLNRLAAAGLPIHISEYDVNLADDKAQEAKYKEQFPVLWSHPAVRGITLWGYQQGKIWREHAYLVRSNGTHRPALTWLQSYVKDASGEITCGPITGVSGERPGIKIYPVPAERGRLTVDPGPGRIQIRVRDAHGRVVRSLFSSGESPIAFDLGESGLYYFEFNDGKNTSGRRVMVD